MAKGRLGNNGGIGGTGVFGFFGSTVTCKSDDTSYYCLFVQFFNVIIMSLVLCFIVYTVYNLFSYSSIFKRGRK